MNIGAVKFKTNGLDGEARREWYELIIRPPFVQSATFSVHPNKNKSKDSEPDYKIWSNYNRKGEHFRGVEVGALWKKLSKDRKTSYLNGFVESPAFANGKLNITLFETKKFDNEDASKIDWLYDVNWQPPRGNYGQSSGYDNTGHTEPTMYTPSSNGNEIPVYVEPQGKPISADEARNYL